MSAQRIIKIEAVFDIAHDRRNPSPERIAQAYVNTYANPSAGDESVKYVTFYLKGGVTVRMRITELTPELGTYGRLLFTGELVDVRDKVTQVVMVNYNWNPIAQGKSGRLGYIWPTDAG